MVKSETKIIILLLFSKVHPNFLIQSATMFKGGNGQNKYLLAKYESALKNDLNEFTLKGTLFYQNTVHIFEQQLSTLTVVRYFLMIKIKNS